MVNPTVFLGTTAMVHPWDKSSWSCLWTKFQRQQKTLVFWVLERNYLDIRVPPFTELFRDLCARVQLQPPLWHRQQDRPSARENWGWKHPETSMPWPLIQGKRYSKHKWFPVVHLCCPGWVDENKWSLWRWKKTWASWKPWSVWGLEMARPGRRSPQLTGDNCNGFDLQDLTFSL